jgi:hypothetical protein
VNKELQDEFKVKELKDEQGKSMIMNGMLATALIASSYYLTK